MIFPPRAEKKKKKKKNTIPNEPNAPDFDLIPYQPNPT
jgi:hypothetical protein